MSPGEEIPKAKFRFQRMKDRATPDPFYEPEELEINERFDLDMAAMEWAE